MDDILLRLGVTGMMAIAMSHTDFKERTIYKDVAILSVGIAVCFLLYDIYNGYFVGMSDFGVIMSVGVFIISGGMILLWRLGMVGAGDVAIVLVMVLINPQIYGVPFVLFALAGGFILSFLYMVSFSAYRNISDMRNGKRYVKSFITHHYKRKGDKYSISCSGARVHGVKDDKLVNSDGESFTLEEDAEGVKAMPTVPMTIPLSCAFVISACVALSGMLSFL